MDYILLYSKYSRSCLRILDRVDDLKNIISLNIVCIDNKNIRKRICSSKTFEISKVPCLLILNGDTVEKYEGEKVFLWMDEIVNNIKNNESNVNNNVFQQNVNNVVQNKNNVNINYEEEEKEEVYVEPERKIKLKPKIKKTKYVPQSLIKKETRIEDLDDEEENDGENNNEEENNEKVKRPPVPIRNGAGNYVFEEELDSEPSVSNYITPNKIKNGDNEKGGNIFDVAMAMRQEREKETK